MLGSLTFDVKSRKGSTIAFVRERSQRVDRKGARIDVSFRNDVLLAR